MGRLDTRTTGERTILNLRSLRLPGAVLLGRYHYTGAHPALPLHRHEQMLEICFLAKGTQCYQVGDELFRLKGGDVFVTFPGEPHSTGQAPEEKGNLYWLILDTRPDQVGFLGCEGAEARKLRESLLRLHPRHFRGRPELRSLLDEMFAVFHDRGYAFRKTALASSLVRFLLKLLEYAGGAGPGAQVSPEIQALQDWIERRLTEQDDLRLAKLAERAGLSLSALKARFCQETGIPPGEYILRQKVRKATALLARGRPVTEVAFELGFSSSQYFATVFRRFVGVSPRIYMERLGEGESRTGIRARGAGRTPGPRADWNR
jgi:AraC-like DNA-binding protein